MDHPRVAPSVSINGPALRAIRERSGMSGQGLARAVGADHSFLARIERGEKRGVGRGTFERIVAVLGIGDPRAILLDPFGSRVVPVGPTVVPSQCSTSTAA